MGKYFTIAELSHSDTADKLGIENKPNGETIHNLDRLISDVLDPLRTKWGSPLVVTSGYRCYRLNKIVGGSATSQHLLGEAADITAGSPEKNKQLLGLLLSSGLLFDQAIDEYDFKWLHISYKWKEVKKNRKQVLKAVKNKQGKTVYINYK